ncbi:MAG: thiol-disulfide oxidoreductase DCC family protein [Ginsengibacter sp.]
MENRFSGIFADMSQHSIILFDGVCNLCNGTIQFIIKRDKKGYFNFASLQSLEGQKLLELHKLPLNNFNSFILIENERAYTRSTGALKVLKKLSGLWPLLYVFILIPKFIRDLVYNRIATNRYKWFGKKDECMIPTPQLKARFLN